MCTHYTVNSQSTICHPVWFVVFFGPSKVLVCLASNLVLCAVVEFPLFLYVGHFMIFFEGMQGARYFCMCTQLLIV